MDPGCQTGYRPEWHKVKGQAGVRSRYGQPTHARKGLPESTPNAKKPGPATRPATAEGWPGPGPVPGCRRLGAGTWAQPQTVIGFDIVSTAIDMRADSGAKDASNSFSEASCSFAVSDIVRSMAARV